MFGMWSTQDTPKTANVKLRSLQTAVLQSADVRTAKYTSFTYKEKIEILVIDMRLI